MQLNLREGENQVREGKANKTSLFWASGGKLILTNERLLFLGHGMNLTQGGLVLELKDVFNVEKGITFSIIAPIPIPNAIKISTQDGTVYKFTVTKRAEWIEAISKALRQLKEEGVFPERISQSEIKETLEMGKTRKWYNSWFVRVPLIILGCFVVGSFFSSEGGLPSCEGAKSTLKEAFDQSQFARAMSLSVIEISNIGESGFDEEKKTRSCKASISMNNAETVSVDYVLEGNEDGTYMLRFEVVE